MLDPFEVRSDAQRTPETITAIRPLPSNPDACTILVGRRSVGRIRTADVETLGLRPGEPWTDARAAAVASAEARERVRRDALRVLARRGLPTEALRGRLTARGHDDDLVAAVLDELRAAGWIDDETLALDAAASLQARRPGPAEAIARRLEAWKVDPELAERAARAAVGDSDPIELALEVARRPLAAAAGEPRSTAARRIAGVLARRGFDEDTVSTVLHRLDLLGEDPE